MLVVLSGSQRDMQHTHRHTVSNVPKCNINNTTIDHYASAKKKLLYIMKQVGVWQASNNVRLYSIHV